MTWNTRIVANTKVGNETSPVISFNRGLPQEDSLFPRLFTLCLNPVSWKLRSTEGYRLSRPVGSKVTNLLYIDDLKVFAASQAKLDRVLKMTKEAMDIGLQWNPKKSNVLNVRRGVPVDVPEGFKSGETVIDSLKEDTTYRFLGAPERLLQEEKLALQRATKTYLQRLSVIWSSPLSDTNRVQASNQLAMPVLSYFMWSQHWCLTDLRDIDRQARKISCESGGKHPLELKANVYLQRALGERGMRSVKEEFTMTKIKSAIKLHSNEDSPVSLVRAFEENAAHQGHQSLVKEASTFAKELGITLDLGFPLPKC